MSWVHLVTAVMLFGLLLLFAVILAAEERWS